MTNPKEAHPIKWVALFAGMIGVVGSLVTISYFNPWTGPSISPKGVDGSAPLSVPFDLQNDNWIAGVNIYSVTCTLDYLSMPFARMRNIVLTDSYGGAHISRLSSRPFRCKLDFPFASITHVTMRIKIKYQLDYLGSMRVYQSQPFTWDNGHWSEGEPL